MISFNELLQIRNQIIKGYKKQERFIVPILKFIITVSVLLLITNSMGYAKPLTKVVVILIMGLIAVFLSPQLMMLFLIVVTSLHALAGSLEAGIIVSMLLLMVYLLFIRLYPVESLFIVATIMAYKFHIPYIIPLVAGLFSSLPTVISLIIGIVIWYSTPQFITMMEGQSAEVADIVGVINEKFITLQGTFKNDQMLLASIVIMSAVLFIVYIIRKQNIDYAEYIAILVGTVMTLLGFLFAVILLKVDVDIAGLMISTIISAIIATIAQFFAKVADYSRAETVQFEDEENYYYVKVVPKIIVKNSKRQIQYNYTKNDMSIGEQKKQI